MNRLHLPRQSAQYASWLVTFFLLCLSSILTLTSNTNSGRVSAQTFASKQKVRLGFGTCGAALYYNNHGYFGVENTQDANAKLYRVDLATMAVVAGTPPAMSRHPMLGLRYGSRLAFFVGYQLDGDPPLIDKVDLVAMTVTQKAISLVGSEISKIVDGFVFDKFMFLSARQTVTKRGVIVLNLESEAVERALIEYPAGTSSGGPGPCFTHNGKGYFLRGFLSDVYFLRMELLAGAQQYKWTAQEKVTGDDVAAPNCAANVGGVGYFFSVKTMGMTGYVIKMDLASMQRVGRFEAGSNALMSCPLYAGDYAYMTAGVDALWKNMVTDAWDKEKFDATETNTLLKPTAMKGAFLAGPFGAVFTGYRPETVFGLLKKSTFAYRFDLFRYSSTAATTAATAAPTPPPTTTTMTTTTTTTTTTIRTTNATTTAAAAAATTSSSSSLSTSSSPSSSTIASTVTVTSSPKIETTTESPPAPTTKLVTVEQPPSTTTTSTNDQITTLISTTNNNTTTTPPQRTVSQEEEQPEKKKKSIASGVLTGSPQYEVIGGAIMAAMNPVAAMSVVRTGLIQKIAACGQQQPQNDDGDDKPLPDAERPPVIDSVLQLSIADSSWKKNSGVKNNNKTENDAADPLRYMKGLVIGDTVFTYIFVLFNFLMGWCWSKIKSGCTLRAGLAVVRFPSLTFLPVALLVPALASGITTVAFFGTGSAQDVAVIIVGTVFGVVAVLAYIWFVVYKSGRNHERLRTEEEEAAVRLRNKDEIAQRGPCARMYSYLLDNDRNYIETMFFKHHGVVYEGVSIPLFSLIEILVSVVIGAAVGSTYGPVHPSRCLAVASISLGVTVLYGAALVFFRPYLSRFEKVYVPMFCVLTLVTASVILAIVLGASGLAPVLDTLGVVTLIYGCVGCFTLVDVVMAILRLLNVSTKKVRRRAGDLIGLENDGGGGDDDDDDDETVMLAEDAFPSSSTTNSSSHETTTAAAALPLLLSPARAKQPTTMATTTKSHQPQQQQHHLPHKKNKQRRQDGDQEVQDYGGDGDDHNERPSRRAREEQREHKSQKPHTTRLPSSLSSSQKPTTTKNSPSTSTSVRRSSSSRSPAKQLTANELAEKFRKSLQKNYMMESENYRQDHEDVLGRHWQAKDDKRSGGEQQQHHQSASMMQSNDKTNTQTSATGKQAVAAATAQDKETRHLGDNNNNNRKNYVAQHDNKKKSKTTQPAEVHAASTPPSSTARPPPQQQQRKNTYNIGEVLL